MAVLDNPWFLLPAAVGAAGLGLAAIRYPILLVCLSIFTVSLDFMGRIGDTFLTYNNLTKVALVLALFIHLIVAGRRIYIPRPSLMAMPFIIFVGVSALHSPDLGKATFAFSRLVIVWIFTILVANFVQTRRHLAYLLGTVVAVTLVSSLLAFGQTLNLMTMGAVETLSAFEPGEFGIRAVGTFYNPNRLALYLLNLSFFLLIALKHRGLAKGWKLFFLLSLLSTLGAILMTFSRAAWVTLGFSSLLFLRFRETRRIIASVMLIGATVLALVLLFTPYGQFLLDRFTSFGRLGSDFSVRFRYYLIHVGLNIWADGFHWLWGAGYTAFQALFYNYLHPLMSHEMAYHTGIYSSHVLWVTLLCETGVIGLTLFLVLIRAVLKEIHRLFALNPDPSIRLPLIACWVLVVARLVDWFANPGLNYNEFWFAIGLVGALGAILVREGRETPLDD